MGNDARGFQFKSTLNNINPAAFGTMTAAQLEAMSFPEFNEFQGRIVGIRRRRRRDMGIWKKDQVVRAGSTAYLFRKGRGEQQFYGGDEVGSYKQTPIHTNMTKNGEFEQGSLTIIHGVEVPFSAGSRAVEQVNGVIRNPKVTFDAGRDPFVEAQAWLQQTELSFWRSETRIFDGLLEDYGAANTVDVAYGSNQGAVAQNSENGILVMPGVQVIEGGEDFHMRLVVLAEMDNTQASGLNIELVQQIKLHTIEIAPQYAQS